MLRKKLLTRAVLLMTALLFLVVLGSQANAATAASTTKLGSGNGLRVSPVRTDLTINPGQTQMVSINVTNITSSPAELQAIFNDFTASNDESGQPALILDTTTASAHGLKKFIVKVPNFTLQPQQQKAIHVNINIPAGTTAGGYYGVVRFAPASLTGTKNVNLAASVGSLILVKVPGDIKEQLSIASLDVRQGDHPRVIFTNAKSLVATVRFQNKGNIQEEPFGKILLKNHAGKTLGQFEINNVDPRGNVLPDSIRKFTVNLKNVGSFGAYTIEGNFGYGSAGQLLSAKTSFYIIPLSLIILVIAVILIILFLIFGLPRLIRAYNQRVIRQASRRR